nr:IS3 family transposase [Geomicrobium sediminis]
MEGFFLLRKLKVDLAILEDVFKKRVAGYSYKWLIETYQLPIVETTLHRYYERYRLHGLEGLQTRKSNQRYSKDFKEKVVQEYVNGHGSLQSLTIAYNIPSRQTLKNWVMRYTLGKEMKDYLPKPEVYTMNARKTTLEERIKITEECIREGLTYKEMAEKYQVKYYQVYQWVKKYKEHGPDALIDGRGKGKAPSVQTDAEKLEAEIKALKARNQWLEMENNVLKKTKEIGRGDDEKRLHQEASYQTIEALKEAYPIAWLCEALGISRASYYKWIQRQTPDDEADDRALMDEITTIYHDHKGIYGYRRITIYLRQRKGMTINHKRVRRLMKHLGLRAVIRQKRKSYRPSTPEVTAENLLNRNFTAERENEKWLTDVTELKFPSGQKAYLSAILDLGKGTIVSHVLGHSNNNKLVFDTYHQAIERTQATHVLLHSDRGYQYTSPSFQRLLKQRQFVQSMSRVGRCIDNGPMEAFWGTLKSEMFHLKKYHTFEELEHDIHAYIKFYNEDRITLKMA